MISEQTNEDLILTQKIEKLEGIVKELIPFKEQRLIDAASEVRSVIRRYQRRRQELYAEADRARRAERGSVEQSGA